MTHENHRSVLKQQTELFDQNWTNTTRSFMFTTETFLRDVLL